MNKKFIIEELSNIKPGYLVLYDYFWGGDSEWHKVLEVAVRCGFDEDGHLVEGYDDYIITYNDDEVSYKDIISYKAK